VEVQLHVFVTSALDGCELSALRLGHFTPGDRTPCDHWIRGLVGPSAGLNAMEKSLLPLRGIKLRLLGGTARNLITMPTEYPGSYASLYSITNDEASR
jgi:hypothetical protein